ncbi:Chromosome (plasmid) partitioning protein ParA [hydrothermal vent metagenome]|uniref:Chromosome (Plasmid) partitioning protein ParA n=1 Tax=hydrothermal vent metagenome TaxID=652676 RepID=A0A3B1BTC0_9ZZZZ
MANPTRRIAIANRKGGSGKTTTAVNLGEAFAMRGHRTLVIDIDPQANASICLGVDITPLPLTIYELLLGMETDINKAIVHTKINKLDLIPSAVRLAGAEVEMVQTKGRETCLREILQDISAQYEYLIVDCPTSFGLLALNALVACDEVMVPAQTHHLSVAAIEQLSDIIVMINQKLNPKLRVTGLIPTLCDRRMKLSKSMIEKMESIYGRNLVRPRIRLDAKLAEAPSKGKPIQLYAPKSNGAYDYIVLADDIRMM